MHTAILVVLLAIFFQSGCSGRSTALLDPASRDPGQDHWAIAAYYSRRGGGVTPTGRGIDRFELWPMSGFSGRSLTG